MNADVIELQAPSLGVETNEQILRRVLNALNEGKVSDATAQFDDHFSFNDHALDLEFYAEGALDRILSEIVRALRRQSRRSRINLRVWGSHRREIEAYRFSESGLRDMAVDE